MQFFQCGRCSLFAAFRLDPSRYFFPFFFAVSLFPTPRPHAPGNKKRRSRGSRDVLWACQSAPRYLNDCLPVRLAAVPGARPTGLVDQRWSLERLTESTHRPIPGSG